MPTQSAIFHLIQMFFKCHCVPGPGWACDYKGGTVVPAIKEDTGGGDAGAGPLMAVGLVLQEGVKQGHSTGCAYMEH